jgi:hypothetical protein
MSKLYLPPELVDHITDFLHEEPEALKQCCLVSKSWIPRTRTHLFYHVRFKSRERLLAWNENFPDPEDTPAIYVRSLSIRWNELQLREFLEFIRSFPRLEYLHVSGGGRIHGGPEAISQCQSSNLPVMTGTLVFKLQDAALLHILSELPNRCRFRNIVQLMTPKDHSIGMKDLVEKCSDTLEYITVMARTSATPCPFGPSDEFST